MREAIEAGVEAEVMTVADLKGTALALLSLSIDLVRWYHPDGPTTPDEIATLHGELALRMVGAA